LKKIRVENEILQKQLKLTQIQAHEILEGFYSLLEKYDDLKAQVVDGSGDIEFRDKYTIEDFLNFMDTDDDSNPLNNAVTYYETHDGCPLYPNCDMRDVKVCEGVWVRMGSPCLYLIKNIKRYSRVLRNHEQSHAQCGRI
ncbi:MAG: hypothetical protein ACTSXU_10355, partial [Promethearchaeota archaeon]